MSIWIYICILSAAPCDITIPSRRICEGTFVGPYIRSGSTMINMSRFILMRWDVKWCSPSEGRIGNKQRGHKLGVWKVGCVSPTRHIKQHDVKGDVWFWYTLKTILKHSCGQEANNSGKSHLPRSPTCSSLSCCNPGNHKISLKDFCVAQKPLKAMKLIISETCSNTTGPLQMTMCVKNSSGLDTEHTDS